MKLLSFHLQGKMAHFRRYYSNSSALSYSIPPRTTISGIIAGLLGYEKDSYYSLFSLEQCQIAVANCKPIKKQMHKLNLLMIKYQNDYNGSQEYHSQTPTELILPENIRECGIDYQVWFHHGNSDVQERLKDLLESGTFGYGSKGISLALGSASHLGWLNYAGEYEGEVRHAKEAVPISSVIPRKLVERIIFPIAGTQTIRLVKEDVPLEFDENRRLTKQGKGEMIINLLPGPIHARVVRHVQLDNGQNVTWME